MNKLMLFRQRLNGYTLNDQVIFLITGAIVLVSIIVIILIIKANRK